MNYGDVEGDLARLLAEFGPPRKAHRPQFPFVRLVNDGVWELNKDDIDTKRDYSSGFLKEQKVAGSFTEGVIEALRNDPELVQEIAGGLLEESFPETMHEDILQAVGLDSEYVRVLDSEYVMSKRLKRNPEFRRMVLKIYDYKCAVCGFDIKLGSMPVALEAVHIKWHQAGGPDIEENGIAMCTMHHKLFDRGAFTFDRSLTLLVSDSVTGTVGVDEWLLRYRGKKLITPDIPVYRPARVFLDWHFREVYRGSVSY